MALVCFDTNVMIWLLRHPQDDREDKLSRKAAHLVDKIDEEGSRLVVPSIVLGEFLHGVSSSERLSFLARIESMFQVSPFDIPAALGVAPI